MLKRSRESKIFPVPSIHPKPTVLVSRAADRPLWVEFVFNLNRLPLRGSNVRGERHQQVARNTLLDGNAGSRVLSVVRAQPWIYLQLRHAGQLGNFAAYLAADA